MISATSFRYGKEVNAHLKAITYLEMPIYKCTFSHVAVGGVRRSDGQQLQLWEQMEGAKQRSSRGADI